MIGAIVGDIAGSRFEFHNLKSKDFELFHPNCHPTDDTVMTLESTDFVDAIRNAVSIGGDSDAIAAITGSIAEAFYGVPERVREKALPYLDPLQKKTLLNCERKLFRMHVTGAGWDSLSADGSLEATVDPESAVEMGLIPSLQDLLEER